MNKNNRIVIVGEKDFNFKMPAKDTVALDDDVELRTVALASPLNRTMVKDALYTEETVETAKGKVLVAFAGDRKKPAIVTYHDLGLNYISNFQASEKIAYITNAVLLYDSLTYVLSKKNLS